MSRDRDPVDNAIESIGGALIGIIIVGTIAYLLGRQRRNSQKDFVLPEGLVVDYDDPFYVPPKPANWLDKLTFLLAFYAFFGALTLAAMMVHYLHLSNVLGVFQTHLLWIFPAFFGCAFLVEVGYKHEQKRKKRARAVRSLDLNGIDEQRMRTYTIMLPKEQDWHPQDAGRFMEQLLLKTERLIFQIEAKPDGITWRILDWTGAVEPAVMRQAIAAFYPAAEVVCGTHPEVEFREPFYRLTRVVCQDQPFINPIAYVSDFKQFDPLVNLVQEMDILKPGERIAYTLAVTEPARFVYEQARDVLTIKPPVNPFDVGSMAYQAGAQLDNRVSPYADEDLKVYVAKLDHLVYQALLFVQADAASEQRAGDLLSLISHVAQFDRHLYNRLLVQPEAVQAGTGWVRSAERASATESTGLLDRWLQNLDMDWRSWRMLLDTQELAALWHLPHEGFQLGSIIWTRGKKVQMPGVMRGKDEGVLLGFNGIAGQTSPVYLPEEDRATHMSVIGQTGVGKSTLLHNLIAADIAAGHGLAVIDPKGHLVRDILRTSIVRSRVDDVVLLDVADTDYPPPMNLLSVPGEVEQGNAVELLLGVFEKLYPDFAGTRMADTFSMAVQTLWRAEAPTLLDVERLFEDVDYRHRLVARSDNFVVQRFWAQFEGKTLAQQDELTQPILYRMRQFYGNRTLLPMMCHPEPLDLYQLVRQNKIILVSLHVSEAKLPPREQYLLGALLISQIQMAAMSGAIAKPPFYLYIDEAQNFVTTSLPQMLSTARSSGLALVMANQHLKQLSGDTLDAVLGNVGAAVAFQCSEHDARIIARLRKGFEVDDLMHLDKYQAGVFMRYKGETQPAFSLETRPAPLPPNPEIGDKREHVLRQESRERYSRRTSQAIMGWLAGRYAAPPGENTNHDKVEDTFYD
ncbi:MAG: type IV secretion system DNA-binding domain-containing protein [Anaerolineae bacterium]|nr:type IV secretion system DNA-binding domain-containing protein [Anaerolineae bacterium]